MKNVKGLKYSLTYSLRSADDESNEISKSKLEEKYNHFKSNYNKIKSKYNNISFYELSKKTKKIYYPSRYIYFDLNKQSDRLYNIPFEIRSVDKNITIKNFDHNNKYELVAILNNPPGHYYVTIKYNDKWYKFNDDEVHKKNDIDGYKANIRALLYKRLDNCEPNKHVVNKIVGDEIKYKDQVSGITSETQYISNKYNMNVFYGGSSNKYFFRKYLKYKSKYLKLMKIISN
jgi:hypothetical protein